MHRAVPLLPALPFSKSKLASSSTLRRRTSTNTLRLAAKLSARNHLLPQQPPFRPAGAATSGAPSLAASRHQPQRAMAPPTARRSRPSASGAAAGKTTRLLLLLRQQRAQQGAGLTTPKP